jgi:hypothetical protein
MFHEGTHKEPPKTWRMTKTVIAAVSMNVTVAMRERPEKRLIPQTP